MGLKELKERLQNKKKELKDQFERGKEVTRQMQDEKRRKKVNKLANMKPGARKAITEGLIAKKSVTQVMKEEYERRKYEREKKRK